MNCSKCGGEELSVTPDGVWHTYKPGLPIGKAKVKEIICSSCVSKMVRSRKKVVKVERDI